MQHFKHAVYLGVCSMRVLQMELKECRLRLAEERRARLKAESRLMEVIIKFKILINDCSFCFVLFFIWFSLLLLFCAAVTSLRFFN